jgi:intracellular sulfur oxidation DsrE/DsrF family protein
MFSILETVMMKLTNNLSLILAATALIIAVLAYNRAGEQVQAIDAPTEAEPPAAIPDTSSIKAVDEQEDDIAKVVYHVDYADPRRYSAMLTSINNMATTFQDDIADYDIRIVFVAHGIRFITDDKLKGTPFAEDADLAKRREELKGRLASLRDVQGIKLELCDITRRQIGLDEDKLYTGVELVTSGVVRLSKLQKQGYAYLKIE